MVAVARRSPPTDHPTWETFRVSPTPNHAKRRLSEPKAATPPTDTTGTAARQSSPRRVEPSRTRRCRPLSVKEYEAHTHVNFVPNHPATVTAIPNPGSAGGMKIASSRPTPPATDTTGGPRKRGCFAGFPDSFPSQTIPSYYMQLHADRGLTYASQPARHIWVSEKS